jgi:S-adenosylmethionine/arginine decarboxylase-like enzyme
MNEDKKVWGYYMTLDLSECELRSIDNVPAIHKFIVSLCDDVLKMKRLGEPKIMESGEGEDLYGYSLIQVIQTSSITGHFVNHTRRAFIDIFSCKEYNQAAVIAFCVNHFKTNKYVTTFALRY